MMDWIKILRKLFIKVKQEEKDGLKKLFKEKIKLDDKSNLTRKQK